MKVTDSPYAAGTPEHNEWIRNVYIPTAEGQIGLQQVIAGRSGTTGTADSQGRKLVVGGPNDEFDELGNLVPFDFGRYIRVAYLDRGELELGIIPARNDYTFFFESFEGLIDVGWKGLKAFSVDFDEPIAEPAGSQPHEIAESIMGALETTPPHIDDWTPLWLGAAVRNDAAARTRAPLDKLQMQSHGSLRLPHRRS